MATGEAVAAGGAQALPGGEVAMPTGAVARRLGVSPTTVRSWERRYGIGPTHREPGHHRRWSPQDIAVLEAMCRLTARGVPPGEAARAALLARGADARPAAAVPSTALLPAPVPSAVGSAGGPEARPGEPGGSRQLALGAVRPECRGLTRAAVRLDAPRVADILQQAVDSLGILEAWTGVMLPALRAAGRKWAADGEQYVEVEHLLSWHVSTVLRAAAVRPTALRPVPPALLAAAPAEEHTLPLEAVAAGLTERGLPFRMLGAAVPPRALLETVQRIGPAAVLLWSQGPRTADRALALRVAAAGWGPRGSHGRAAVLAAGPGWRRAEHPAGVAAPRSLAGALDLLEELMTR
ncbi:transcriptional regulator [Streptomyces tateyamensis]|uniref:Transcriptional regulator n=2 Tax=Streptomyces tateyamensis TaxID=565073 RepID=A0A2V4NTT4_9ACTN|nr:transcriptional regulator [Streptomyces tateyamensis]